MWVTSSPTTALTPTAVALGNFDGVHRGHQQVIQPTLNTKPAADCRITVVTFNPHPREFFTGHSHALLTPLGEKVIQLQSMGVEQLVLLPFDRELADLNPQQFVETILIQKLQATLVSVGVDFRFGRQRSGTAEDLQAIAAQFGIEVKIVPLQTCQGERISSSAIRQALEQGDLQRANRLLGRSYSLVGQVVQGQQLGRTLGFPTANLNLPSSKFLPRNGVYCVRVQISAAKPLIACQPTSSEEPIVPEASPWLAGVLNIGYRPTIDGSHQTIEVHLLDWLGDLYGQTVTVQIEQFLRPEQKFASLAELKAQIEADCDAARGILMAVAKTEANVAAVSGPGNELK